MQRKEKNHCKNTLFHSYIIKLLSAILNKILRENFGYVKEFILGGMVKTSGEIDRKCEKVVARRKAERLEALARLMYC
jgi:hypothetical protein